MYYERIVTDSRNYEDYCSDTLKIWKNASVFSSYIGSAIIADDAYVKDSRLGQNVLLNKGARVLKCDIDDMTQIGFSSKIFYANIGKYCSISWDVSIGGPNHRFDNITSYTWGMMEELCEKTECCIGNDVWIGAGSIIHRGVRIGDGAVVASGAVVTRDVMPYEMVGGVIAKHLKWRFDEDVREKLRQIAWWELPTDTINQNRELIQKNPTSESLWELEQLKAEKIQAQK